MQPFPNAFRLYTAKASALLLFGTVIGILDDLQVRYIDFGRYGDVSELMYQAIFIGATSLVAFFVLRNKNWSVARNASNLLMSIPIAVVGDNISIDAGTLKPYVLIIPQAGYVWRQTFFGHYSGVSQVAAWVNGQTITTGLINGYVAGIGIAVVYIVVQIVWTRRTNNSLLKFV